jgi:hypothetical protein
MSKDNWTKIVLNDPSTFPPLDTRCLFIVPEGDERMYLGHVQESMAFGPRKATRSYLVCTECYHEIYHVTHWKLAPDFPDLGGHE